MKLSEIADKLKEPFPPGEEKYRPGATFERDGKMFGFALSYIDARSVYDRLDAVVGPDGWETHLEQISTGVFKCRLSVLGITREDIGMAGDNESEKEKSGASDAVKRAAVQFGIGRYLYERELSSVELVKQGRNWVIPKGWKPGNSSRPAQQHQPSQQQAAQPKPGPATTPNLSEAQIKRMFAIAKKSGVSNEQVKVLMEKEFHIESTKDLNRSQYDRLCDELLPNFKQEPEEI